jgi:hypothetical protein
MIADSLSSSYEESNRAQGVLCASCIKGQGPRRRRSARRSCSRTSGSASVRAEVNSEGKLDVRVGVRNDAMQRKQAIPRDSTRGRLDIPASPRMSAAAAPMMHSSVKMRGLVSTAQH